MPRPLFVYVLVQHIVEYQFLWIIEPQAFYRSCLEVVSAMLFIAFFMVVRKLKTAIILCIVTLIISGLSTYSVLHFDVLGGGNLRENYLFYWFPNQLPVFCLGIVLFYLLKDKLNPNTWRKNDAVSHIIILCAIIIIGGLAISGGVEVSAFQVIFYLGLGLSSLVMGSEYEKSIC